MGFTAIHAVNADIKSHQITTHTQRSDLLKILGLIANTGS
jgi:hypothetical protein